MISFLKNIRHNLILALLLILGSQVAFANIEAFELDRKIQPLYQSQNIFLEFYVKDKPTIQERTDLMISILKEELNKNEESTTFFLTLYQDSYNSTDNNELQKTATAYISSSSCKNEYNECQNAQDFNIKFLNNFDKSGLQQFDDFVKEYRSAIVYLTPILILTYLQYRKRRKKKSLVK